MMERTVRSRSLSLIIFILFLLFYGCEKKQVFNNGDVYYDNTVTIAEVNRLGNYLVQKHFFDGRGKSVKLLKNNQTYELHLVLKKGYADDPEMVEKYKEFGIVLSNEIFGEAHFDLHLSDDSFNTLRVIVIR